MYVIPIILSLVIVVRLYQKNLLQYNIFSKTSSRNLYSDFNQKVDFKLLFLSNVLLLVILMKLFNLKLYYCVFIILNSLLLLPVLKIYLAKERFYENEFNELHSFMNHFILAFKQHKKVYTTFLDIRSNIQKPLRSVLDESIESIENNEPLRTSLEIIEKEFPHFIVSNLFSYIENIEQYGFNDGYQTLMSIQNDLDYWYEDVKSFKNSIRVINQRTLMLVGFSFLICFMAKNMLVQAGLIMSNQIYQTSVFIFCNINILSILLSYQFRSKKWIEEKECI